MKKNNELVVPVLILGAGIGLYFLNKAGKLDKIKALFNKNNAVVNPVTTINPPPPSTNPPPRTNPNVIVANPFTQPQLLAFQKWVNLTYKPTIPLVEDGLWGTNSAGAYNSYATAYANKDKTIVTINNQVVVPPTALKKGDKVNAKKPTATYPGYTLANPYKDGATDGDGNYSLGYYVGVIKQIVGSATQVERFSKPYPKVVNVFTTDEISTFWVKTSDIEKSLI